MSNSLPVLDHGFVKLLNISSFAGECKSVSDVGNWARMDFTKSTSGAGLTQKLWDENPRHQSPFETIETWWHIRAPIFVTRQIMRTRTASFIEHSGRYFEFGAKIPVEFYNPFNCCPTITQNLSEHKRSQLSELWEQDSARALYTYQQYLELLTSALNCSKRAREIARNKLPVEVYTEFGMKIDLLNLLKFLYNRRDKGAQWETRQYANKMFTLLEDNLEGIEKLTLQF
jgi:thymidylate synthase (FAD)